MIQQEEDSPIAYQAGTETVDNYIPESGTQSSPNQPKSSEICGKKSSKPILKDYQGLSITGSLRHLRLEAIIDDHLWNALPGSGMLTSMNSVTMSNTIVGKAKQSRKASSSRMLQRPQESRNSWMPQPKAQGKNTSQLHTKLIEKVIEPLRVGR